MIYSTKDEKWCDETGMQIPRNRITPFEKQREKVLGKLQKDAEAVSIKLTALKEAVKKEAKELFEMAMNDNLVKVDAKGNWSIYSFDRSLMLDVAVSTPVRFDDLTILAAQSILNEFLSETIESKLSYVKDFVRDAFSTSRGKLDTKKVVGLLKWQTKINSEKYDKACELIKKAIVRPDSKTYYRIFVKDGEGEYQCIDLNFSNI